MNDAGPVTTAPALDRTRTRSVGAAARAIFELLLITGPLRRLQPGPAVGRHAWQPAVDRANDLLDVEGLLGISWEVTAQPALRRPSACWGWSAATGTPPPTTSSPRSCWSGSTASAPTATAPPAGRWSSPPCSAWCPTSLPMAPPRLHRRVRRRAQPALRRRLVGRGRVGPARARRAHQPARRVPVAARRLGAVGGAGAAGTRPASGCASLGWAYAARDGGRHRRHRQPLGARRGRRLAGGRVGLERRRRGRPDPAVHGSSRDELSSARPPTAGTPISSMRLDPRRWAIHRSFG